MRLFKPNIQRLLKEKNVLALIRVLKDPRWDAVTGEHIRIAAALALAEIGNRQAATEPLIFALQDRKSGREIRQAVAQALGKVGDPRAVCALKDALWDPSDVVRLAAMEALVRIGPPAVEPLIVALSLVLEDLGLHLTVTRDRD